jgi:S1-C subfamily serine protease
VVLGHLALGLPAGDQAAASHASDAALAVKASSPSRASAGAAPAGAVPGAAPSPAAVAAPAYNFPVAENFGMAELEARFADVARRVAPAVVAISGTDTPVQGDAPLRSEEINPDKLTDVLDTVDRSVGTGFIIDPDGYIATNDHVVGKAEQLWVTTDDHKVYPAIVVGSDPRQDIAILKIPATELPTVHLSDGPPVHRGQWTIDLGNPYGLAVGGDMSMSVGVISATSRSLPKLSGKEDRLYSDLIQTTAQINPGDSGGPLFDLHGDVIGINTAVILPQKATNGIGFAIPITRRVRRIVRDLVEGREVVYSYLGIKSSTPTARERKLSGIDEEIGAYIESVDKDSPAGNADLRKGDIVIKFNGEVIPDGDHFIRAVGAAPVGRPVVAVYYRKDKCRSTDVLLRRRETTSAVTRESRRFRWRGMLLGSIPARWDFGRGKKPENGVMVIGIDPNSPLVKEGVAQGSVITSIAGVRVSDVTEVQRIINDVPPDRIALEVAGRQEVIASTIIGAE